MSSARDQGDYLEEFRVHSKRIKEKMQTLENELKKKTLSQSDLPTYTSEYSQYAVPHRQATPSANFYYASDSLNYPPPLVDMYGNAPTLNDDLHARLGLGARRWTASEPPSIQQASRPETVRSPLGRYHNNVLNQRTKYDTLTLSSPENYLADSTKSVPYLTQPMRSSPYRTGLISPTADPNSSDLFLPWDEERNQAPTTRQISVLLSTLEKSKMENEKLSEKLKETEAEVKRLKVNTEDMKREFEAKISEKVSETIAEVYMAQKHRDEAVIGRLKAEKDSVNDLHSTVKPEELALLERRYQKAMIERNGALERMAILEDELQNLRIYYSLHKSFANSPENGHKKTKSKLDGNVSKETNATANDSQLDYTVGQLKIALAEKAKLADEVIQLQGKLKDEEMKRDKLNRIILVLRKKLGSLEQHV